MPKTLLTILGKGRDNLQTGYRTANYRFADGTTRSTPFFGLALAEHLKPQTLVILGTNGSMWGVLVEHFAQEGEHETLRLELMEAEAQGNVTQALLDRATPLLQRSIAHEVVLKLIPGGEHDHEQVGILEVIADTLGKKQAQLHFDITHGFRHLAIIGFLSAAMLERLRSQLQVDALWYGALDMTQNNTTPVIRLDGLNAVQNWVSALDRFDASGNYGVFTPLLEADGLPHDKANCLKDAAFYETTTQVASAARSLNTLLPALETPLSGASALFQQQLTQRLNWARDNNLARQQRLLAERALKRGDYLRCCILGLESLITYECDQMQLDPYDYRQRKEASEAIHDNRPSANVPDWLKKSFGTLNSLRNAMAHGTRPPYKPHQDLIRNPQRLGGELQRILGQIGTHIQGHR